MNSNSNSSITTTPPHLAYNSCAQARLLQFLKVRANLQTSESRIRQQRVDRESTRNMAPKAEKTELEQYQEDIEKFEKQAGSIAPPHRVNY